MSNKKGEMTTLFNIQYQRIERIVPCKNKSFERETDLIDTSP